MAALASSMSEAAVALILKGSEVATRIYESAPDETLELGEHWAPLGDIDDHATSITLRLTPTVYDARALAVSSAIAELRQSSEAAAFGMALRADPDLGPIIGKMAFTAGQGLTISPEQLVQDVLNAALTRSPWETTAEAAAGAWRDFVDALLSDRIQVTMVAPVANFAGPAAAVQLGEGLELDRMTHDELARAVKVGAVTTPFPGSSPGLMWVTSRWAVRVGYEVQKTIADAGDVTSFEDSERLRLQAIERIEGVLQALRLYKTGFVSAEAAMSFGSQEPTAPGFGEWIQRFSLQTYGGRHGPTYELLDDELGAFVHFHDTVTRARRTHAPFEAAMRRFSYAADRRRPDDQLTDLIIALEALLLDDSERGEKRFQVALRTAAFAEIPGSTRRSVFKFVKRAYDVRSTIVHGGVPKPQLLKDLVGETVGLQEFADVAAEVIRIVLRRVVEIVEEDGSFSVDWELQLLGDA